LDLDHLPDMGQNDRSIAITHKNFLFLGSEAGERTAILYTVLETVKRPRALVVGQFTHYPSLGYRLAAPTRMVPQPEEAAFVPVELGGASGNWDKIALATTRRRKQVVPARFSREDASHGPEQRGGRNGG
jgi:hypothetical protein